MNLWLYEVLQPFHTGPIAWARVWAAGVLSTKSSARFLARCLTKRKKRVHVQAQVFEAVGVKFLT